MINREDLQKKYATLSISALMNIIDNKLDYTELAVTVAIEELAKRNPSEEDIKNYKDELIQEANTFIAKNLEVDLSTWQKMLFYLFWLPILTFAFKQNYRQYGYELKLRQANYYSLIGFVVFMLCGFISVPFSISDFTLIGIWMSVFFPAYLFDEHFNRLHQLKQMKKMFDIRNEQKEEEVQ